MAAIWTRSILASLVGSVHSDVPDATIIGAACTRHVQFALFLAPVVIFTLLLSVARESPGLDSKYQHPNNGFGDILYLLAMRLMAAVTSLGSGLCVLQKVHVHASRRAEIGKTNS